MTNNNKTAKLSLILGICTVLLSACIRPYQPDVQQGNILNNSDLKELSYGMSKQEVLFILGTPMVIDPFNESRWDYYYSNLDQRKRQTDSRLVTALFDGDELVKLEGHVDLSNIQALEPSTEDKQHGGSVITEPTQKPKGLFNRMKIFKKDKNKASKSASKGDQKS
jgi:outer membrane protein assembly factor BamE